MLLRHKETEHAIRVVLVTAGFARVESFGCVALSDIFRPLIWNELPCATERWMHQQIVVHGVQSLLILLVRHVFCILQSPRSLRLLKHEVATVPSLRCFPLASSKSSCDLREYTWIKGVIVATIRQILQMCLTQLVRRHRLARALRQVRQKSTLPGSSLALCWVYLFCSTCCFVFTVGRCW